MSKPLRSGWLKRQLDEVEALQGHWCYQHQKAVVHIEDLPKSMQKKIRVK